MLFLNLLLILSKFKLWLDLLKKPSRSGYRVIFSSTSSNGFCVRRRVVLYNAIILVSVKLNRDYLPTAIAVHCRPKSSWWAQQSQGMLLMVEWLLWAVDVIVVALDIAIFAIVRRRWYCKSVRLYGLSVIGVWININKWSSSTNNKRWRDSQMRRKVILLNYRGKINA